MKKVTVINDISGFGRCSLAVALPIISTLGVQCCPLVTSVFSAQTGYKNFHYTDLTDDIEKFGNKWAWMNADFDGILTGFISSAVQGKAILDFVKKFKGENTLLVVDPVMGDDGAIYPCYNEQSVQIVKELASMADIITPNTSELAMLANEPFIDESIANEELLAKILSYSQKVSGKTTKVVTTGISLGDDIASAVYENGEFFVTKAKKYGGSFSGTGDIFASIITALCVRGFSLKKAAEVATDFISECAKITIENKTPDFDRNDGVEFEKILYTLGGIRNE